MHLPIKASPKGLKNTIPPPIIKEEDPTNPKEIDGVVIGRAVADEPDDDELDDE